uniref:non-specific protein-tyrosine kinase n=1 Tax=Panagrellus redivivus TaxID=6233 RepID=A0A7E4V9Q7_PANRE
MADPNNAPHPPGIQPPLGQGSAPGQPGIGQLQVGQQLTGPQNPQQQPSSPNGGNGGPGSNEGQPSMLTNNAAVIAALLGKCDFPKNKMLMNYTDEVNRRGHKLEAQQWYLGMLNGSDVAPYLKKIGEFGIHATDQQGGAVKLMLTVKGANAFYHLDLTFDARGRGWTVAPMCKLSRFHKTVIDLVEFHKTTPLPNCAERICLIDSMTRPKWFLKHDNVTFEKSDLLGRGNFCEVYRGKLEKRTTIAIKVCHANWRYTSDVVSISTNVKEQQARDALIKEGYVMSRIRHPNVIAFYGICCDHPPIMIALELCPGDSLLRHLVNLKEAITVGERIKFLVEAAEGMAFLQKNELVHRDLAARNCLISKFGKVKIADFGLSKLVSQLAGEQWLNQQIPVRWMAPETLKPQPEYSIKSDVWAFGILMYEVFNYGEKPWPDWENKRIATHIRRCQMPDLSAATPIQIKQLVADLWKLNPGDRPDFAAILKRINDIQTAFPAPRPQFCTTSRIKGVTVLSAAEMEVLQENSEDIQLEVVTSTFSQPSAGPVDFPPSVHGNVIERQPMPPPPPAQGQQAGTVASPTPQGRAKPPKEPTIEETIPPGESNKKKKGRKKNRDATRDTHEEAPPNGPPNNGQSAGIKKKKKKPGAAGGVSVDQTTVDDKESRTVEENSNTDPDQNETTQDKPNVPANPASPVQKKKKVKTATKNNPTRQRGEKKPGSGKFRTKNTDPNNNIRLKK